jgi:hypothetical protein
MKYTWDSREAMQGKQTKRNASELGIGVRRGVTVVGDLV